jgi:hypothetical protein
MPQYIVKDLEGNGRDLTYVPSRHLCRGTEYKITKEISKDNRCTNCHSKSAPSEYKSTALSPDHHKSSNGQRYQPKLLQLFYKKLSIAFSVGITLILTAIMSISATRP